jgi:hypothetical protein
MQSNSGWACIDFIESMEFPGGFAVSPVAKSGILAALVTILASCSHETGHESPRIEVTAESLVGRWRAVPKDVAAETPDGQDMKGALGETFKFRWEFKNDQTCTMSIDVDSGIVPLPGRSATVPATWKVVEVRGDTLIIEISRNGGPAAQTKIAFESKDKCLYNAGEDEVMVLTRLP